VRELLAHQVQVELPVLTEKVLFGKGLGHLQLIILKEMLSIIMVVHILQQQQYHQVEVLRTPISIGL
jgi:hypothetical protein